MSNDSIATAPFIATNTSNRTTVNVMCKYCLSTSGWIVEIDEVGFGKHKVGQVCADNIAGI